MRQRSTGHTYTHRQRTTPPTHTHDTNNTANPQTKPPHKHLTRLEGGATTVRAASHARVGARAEVSSVWYEEYKTRVEDQRPFCQSSSKRLEVNWQSCLVSLRVEYAEQSQQYGILFRVRLLYEYTNLE